MQTSYVPNAITLDDIKELPLGYQNKKGTLYEIKRTPTEREFKDMHFGWLVESGITSDSVIYVKDGVTVGIGTGEQDRVGVAKIARDKAYEKARDGLCFARHGISYNDLILTMERVKGDRYKKLQEKRSGVDDDVAANKAGLKGAVMVSDAFFPFRDGADVGLREGVSAIIQPGGSLNDYQAIEACNERGATMIYTGQRSFKH